MKRQLLLILALMTTIFANATITPSSTQIWWGYFSDSDISGIPYSGHLGYNQACTIDAASYIPAGQEFVGDSKIKAVRIWLGNEVAAINSDMTVWISKTQPSDISKSDYKQTVAKSSLVKGANDIMLTTAFDVKNQGFYVGFTLSISKSAYLIMGNGSDVPNSFYYRVNGDEWMDFYGYGYGKLAIQLLLDGGTYPSNCATVDDFSQNVVVVKGQSVNVPIKITNKGKNSISSISYTISTEGGSTSSEKTLSLGSLAFNCYKTVNVSFSSDSEPAKKNKTFTITKVNGVANTASQKSGTGSLITVTEVPAVLPVIEEFTGTWCGYCPYGIVGMQKAHETYGDQVALIAVHASDVMSISGYNPILYNVGSYPSAKMNRTVDFYPSSYPILSQIDGALKSATLGSIELTARWTDSDKKAIKFDTKTKFVYNDDNGQYGISFVLVEDGMKGEGSSWAQRNFLSGSSGDSEMSFWYNSGQYVSGIEFNHVAVEAWDILNGVSGSVSSTIQAGQVQKFSYNGDISSNTLIQDKSKLKAIALLIDKETGRIVNAAQTTIDDSFLVGDVNIDGLVDISDVVALVNMILGTTEKNAPADVNNDGLVDISDVVALVNIILGA